jgi:DNA mismatch repair protein MutS2
LPAPPAAESTIEGSAAFQMNHALKILEFSAIQERLQFHCETPLAAIAASELFPTFKEAEVWERLELTQEAHTTMAKHSPPALGGLGDPRNALNLASKGGVLGGADLFRIGEGLAVMRSLKAFLENRKLDLPRLSSFAQFLPEQRRLEQELLDSLESDGNVRDAASSTLASVRARKKAATQRIQERVQSYISGRSRELLSDPIYTMRDGRYVLPLKAENRGKIRGIVHDTSSSGQTIYIEPEDVLQAGNALREVEAAERAEIQRLLIAWSGKVGAVSEEIIGGVEAASQIDFALAKARLAYEHRAVPPQKSPRPHWIDIHGARHPLLDQNAVVPIDIRVGVGDSVLITGPNTGGKTVAIKCVGLFALMAQSGLFLPALEVQFSPFSGVWGDIGDEQSLQQSLSTFSGHIKNIAEALRNNARGSLVLLDEVGAGTDPAEGAALAKAILEALAKGGAAILASTHYGELKAFAYNQDGFTNAAMEFDPKTLRPTYRVLMGAPGASQALRIAERYGIPKDVVEQARESLGDEAQDLAGMIERLENSQRQARVAQSEADRRTAELRAAEEKAKKKLAEAEEIRRTAHSKANEVIEAALREIRLEASRLFEELKASASETKSIDRIRGELRGLDQVGRDFAAEFLPRKKTGPLLEVRKGMQVQIEGFSQPGTVVGDVKDGQVAVQAGMIRITVALDRLKPADKAAPPGKPKPNIRLQKTLNATTEIDLRHLRAEEAIRELERFLDDAVLAGLDNIRIVHGKGEGILRKATQDFLRHYPSVGAFRDGEPAEGGQGVTIAALA